ncbi:MAG: hypothetical protein M3462_02260, partial [Chloroflexota bacterium]|nr:hypothetical protein [Chloroflexota bacterium]
MKRLPILSFVAAIFALALAVLPAGAQTAPAELNLNAYQCPADYDQISDCVKLSGVVVDVAQNQAFLTQLVTSNAAGVTADLTVGAFVDLGIVEIPAGTELQADTALSFTAVEGQNPVTLIFIEQDVAAESYLELNSYLCPADYIGLDSDCERLGGILVDVSQDQGALGQLTTSDAGSVSIDLTVGANVDLAVVEIPEGTDFGTDSENLSFTAVAGANVSTLVFVELTAPQTSDLIVRALVCPVDYEGDSGADYEANCDPELDIAVSVTGETGGETIDGATGDDGSVTFIDLDEDDYTIELGV